MIFMTASALKNLFCAASLVVAALSSCQQSVVKAADNTKGPKVYFLNTSGNDANNGSKANPWKTISKLNNTKLLAGDTVYFEGGQTFTGSILLSADDAGTSDKP